MRTLASIAAFVLLTLAPAGAFATDPAAGASATDPADEMTSQMHEWVNYERPLFEPVEVQVDGAKLTVLDATIESHPFEDDTTIVKVTMRAHRGESPATVSRVALKHLNGSSYPVAYVKAAPGKVLKEQGFKVYTFRLPETDQESLKSLEVTVASAKEGAEPTSTQVELDVGEQVRFSDLDFASFSAGPAFLMFFYYIITTSSAF